MSNSADLPDLNVWLALATPDHVHHQQAVAYWEEQAAEQVLFCTVTALLQAFCQQPGVRMATPASDGWDVCHQLMGKENLPARLSTDTYLAALAIRNGWRLVSFDRDFKRYTALERLTLI